VIATALLLVLLGPAQTLAGKYIQHSEEYLKLYGPVPAEHVRVRVEPGGGETVNSICARIERGDHSAKTYEMLGEALAERGDNGLAHRAFRKAHAQAEEMDRGFKQQMLQRMFDVGTISKEQIQREEKQAAEWVRFLQEYERKQIAAGRDPNDLEPFYAMYGRPEDDMYRTMWRRRASFLIGAAGVLVGLALLLCSRRIVRLFGGVGIIVALSCALGPGLLGQVGLFYWGAAFSAAGGLTVLLWGKKSDEPKVA